MAIVNQYNINDVAYMISYTTLTIEKVIVTDILYQQKVILYTVYKVNSGLSYTVYDLELFGFTAAKQALLGYIMAAKATIEGLVE